MEKNEIFIASRFHEFKELRELLRKKINDYKFLEAVDLNNNEATHRSPLSESLFCVKKSKIMILLIGETYGTIPENQQFSFTHLEYKEAIKETSNTRVLVFCIGESYKNQIEYSSDENLKKWQIELEQNHRLKKFTDTNIIHEIAEKILIDVQSSLYDMNIYDQNSDEEKIDLTNINELDKDFLEDSEVAFLESKSNDVEEINLILKEDENITGFDLLKIPNKLASMEQKKEAQYAIDIKDYSTAIIHLKKSLNLRPLDFETNYWLAKLYITTAKKSLFYEIEEYLLRAAKIAEKSGNIYKASHCYQLIVQASIFSDKYNEGLKYITLAQELTPSFSKLFYEKAKFMLYNQNFDDARKALIETVNIRIDAISLIENDPFFKNHERFVNEVFFDMKNQLYKITEAILYETNKIRSIFNFKLLEINLKEDNIISLWGKSRSGIINQYKIISHQLDDYKENDILNIKETISKETNEYENKIKKEIKNYDEKLEIIDNNYKENILIEKEKLKNKKTRSLNLTFLSFITLLCATLLFFLNSSNEFKLILIITFMITFTSFYHLYKKKSTNQFLNTNDKLTLELENEKTTLKKEHELKQNEYLKEYEKKKLVLNGLIEDYQIKYKNLKNALTIFEEKSITITQSKFMPFKSLKNFSYNNIIRINKRSYEKFVESNNLEIEIKNDFPEYLNIANINFEDNKSFLVKVIHKSKNKIILSRKDAYVI